MGASRPMIQRFFIPPHRLWQFFIPGRPSFRKQKKYIAQMQTPRLKSTCALVILPSCFIMVQGMSSFRGRTSAFPWPMATQTSTFPFCACFRLLSNLSQHPILLLHVLTAPPVAILESFVCNWLHVGLLLSFPCLIPIYTSESPSLSRKNCLCVPTDDPLKSIFAHQVSFCFCFHLFKLYSNVLEMLSGFHPNSSSVDCGTVSVAGLPAIWAGCVALLPEFPTASPRVACISFFHFRAASSTLLASCGSNRRTAFPRARKL